jgi:NADH dehydrogenase [ubiquinone] 1 alpha subcomplex assembly factor 7
VSYDVQVRRPTPLARLLQERIAREGPISVREYMQACLYHPEHGYYRTRGAIGSRGDFITAPEISQVFGELIGLWSAVVWQGMGSPQTFDLVEAGPGRGTLMRDMLRATRRIAGFHAAIRVRLLETSEALAAQQRITLADAEVAISWHADLEALSRDIPRILIANEVLDCEPRHQLVRRGETWVERRVGLDADQRLTFSQGGPLRDSGPDASPIDAPLSAHDGDVFEPSRFDWLWSATSTTTAMAALLIDYGHTTTSCGDTLQAVRDHGWEHPLASPGEADLTMQVDFGSLVRQASAADSLAVDGPLTQSEFLGRLGAVERASRLMAASPSHAAQIEAGVARLLSPTGMGTRFHVVGLRSRSAEPLPGFATMDKAAHHP